MKGIKRVLAPLKQEGNAKNVPEGAERRQTKMKPLHVPMENGTMDPLGLQDQVVEACSLSSSGSPSESKSQTDKNRGSVYVPINKLDAGLQSLKLP